MVAPGASVLKAATADGPIKYLVLPLLCPPAGTNRSDPRPHSQTRWRSPTRAALQEIEDTLQIGHVGELDGDLASLFAHRDRHTGIKVL